MTGGSHGQGCDFLFWARYFTESRIRPNIYTHVCTSNCTRTLNIEASILNMSKRKQLCLSRKKPEPFRKKPKPLNQLTDDVDSPNREPGEVYNGNIAYPSGFTNPASNCYINAVLQCMFNTPSFSCIFNAFSRVHSGDCDKNCCRISKCSRLRSRSIGKGLSIHKIIYGWV